MSHDEADDAATISRSVFLTRPLSYLNVANVLTFDPRPSPTGLDRAFEFSRRSADVTDDHFTDFHGTRMFLVRPTRRL